MNSNSQKREKSFVKPASILQRRLVLAISFFVVLAFGALNPLYYFGFAGIFIGELLRYSSFGLRLCLQLATRVVRIELEEKAKDLAAQLANKEESVDASAQQICEIATKHSLATTLSDQFMALLVERLRAALGGIVHVSLSCRLLPAPFSAR
jgi:hypothetical protein